MLCYSYWGRIQDVLMSCVAIFQTLYDFTFHLFWSIRYCIIRQFSVLPMKYYCRWWFIDYFQCLFFSSPNTLPITLSPTLDRGLPITLSPTLDRGLSITLSPTLDRG